MADEQRINYKDNHGKSPNFGLILAGAGIFLVLALIGIYLFLHRDAKKMVPHGPNPEPNSLSVPYRIHPQATLLNYT